jgi:hypothetical protein
VIVEVSCEAARFAVRVTFAAVAPAVDLTDSFHDDVEQLMLGILSVSPLEKEAEA